MAGIALLLAATSAVADTRLQSSDPADGSSLSTAPDTVSLVFNEGIEPEFRIRDRGGPGRYELRPTVAAPPSIDAAAQATGQEKAEDGAPVRPWFLGALALIVVAVALALRRMRT